MTVWSPICKVFIEGVEYTADTLARVNITYGKRDLSDSFRAANANVQIISSGAGIGVDLNDEVLIKLQDTAAVDKVIFTGRVLDISVEMVDANFVVTTLQLLSPVARLGRRFITDSFPHEFDGARIANILTFAGNVLWLEAGGDWINQVGTWNQYEVLSGVIDPGTYELHQYTAGGFTTELLTIAELSGQGHLWESTDGLVNYQDADGRQADVTANGYEPIPSDDVMLNNTIAEVSTAFTTNSVEVETFGGYIADATEYASVAIYGRIYEKYETWLRNNVDADNWATDYLGHYAYPKPVLSSFTIPLSQVTTSLRDVLINMRGGLPVSISGLPAALAPNPYEGFVEGWRWKIIKGEAFITLNVSDKALSL